MKNSIDENPDVAELIRYNKEGCKHEVTKIENRSRAVGSGMAGVIGCHMEHYHVVVCQECKQELKPALDPFWANIFSALTWKS